MNVHQPVQTGVHIGAVSDREEAAAARAVLAAHVPDPERNLCAVCLVHGPCRPANLAANRLVELGQPVCPPDRPRRPRRGWRDWIAPRRPKARQAVSQPAPAPPPFTALPALPRAAPLLTHVWRSRFGLADAGQPIPVSR